MPMLLQSTASRWLSDALADLGVPYADPLAGPATFLVATIVVYLLGRVVAIPLMDRAMDARGVDECRASRCAAS